MALVPQDHLRQLEVYSFGNAANHFNNPGRLDKGTVTHESIAARSAPTYASMANIGDYVAQIGVLHFALNPRISNRFMGRVFTSPYSGHLLNEHYLHEMFPLGEDGKCLESNPFMDLSIDLIDASDLENREDMTHSVQDGSKAKPGLSPGHPNAGAGQAFESAAAAKPVTEVSVIGDLDLKDGDPQEKTWKVKNLSRLWLYRNGSVPPDVEPRRAETF
jgi:hypothetical protein